jgi:hypothetical protein
MTPAEGIRRVKFSPDLNLGHVLQVVAVVGGLTVWAISSADKADQAQKDIASLRVEMNARFDAVQHSISTLPDVQAQMTQINRRLDQGEQRQASFDGRIGAVERLSIGVRSDVDNMIRASSIQLPEKKR